mgnify:FL=1
MLPMRLGCVCGGSDISGGEREARRLFEINRMAGDKHQVKSDVVYFMDRHRILRATDRDKPKGGRPAK